MCKNERAMNVPLLFFILISKWMICIMFYVQTIEQSALLYVFPLLFYFFEQHVCVTDFKKS